MKYILLILQIFKEIIKNNILLKKFLKLKLLIKFHLSHSFKTLNRLRC